MMKIFTNKISREDDFREDYEQEEGGYDQENYKNDDEDAKGQIALDILSDEEFVTIIAPVAGIDLDDIDISVTDSTLTLRGRRNKPTELYHDESQLKVSECYWGKFIRNVILPENLDFGQIKAIMENNLLVIRIPKIYHNKTNVYIDKVDDIS